MDNYFVCVVRRYRSEAHNIKPRSIDCSNLNYGTKFADSHAPSSIGYSIEPYNKLLWELYLTRVHWVSLLMICESQYSELPRKFHQF